MNKCITVEPSPVTCSHYRTSTFFLLKDVDGEFAVLQYCAVLSWRIPNNGFAPLKPRLQKSLFAMPSAHITSF